MQIAVNLLKTFLQVIATLQWVGIIVSLTDRCVKKHAFLIYVALLSLIFPCINCVLYMLADAC
jgi:hypothetical protein